MTVKKRPLGKDSYPFIQLPDDGKSHPVQLTNGVGRTGIKDMGREN